MGSVIGGITAHILVLSDNVFEQLSIDFAVVPLLLHVDAKDLSGLYFGRVV